MNSVKNSQKFIYDVVKFFSGTMLCRITGFFRELFMAACFGSSPEIALFFLAYRNSYLIKMFFGDKAIQSVFIPLFTKFKNSSVEKGLGFFFITRKFCLFMMTMLTTIAMSLMIAIMTLGSIGKSVKDVLLMTTIMLPMQIFSSLMSVNNALLYCEKKFFVPSITPAIANCMWIIGVLLLYALNVSYPMSWISFVILLTSIMEWKITGIATEGILIKNGKKIDRIEDIVNKDDIKNFLRKWIIVAFGVGAVNINLICDSIFARRVDLSGPAYLNYAIRLQQAPIGLIAVAFSIVLLPQLSKIGDKDSKEKHSLLIFAINKSSSILIPCSGFFMAAGFAIVQAAFERGAFDVISSVKTAKCLWGYAPGLIPIGISTLLVPLYYSCKNFSYPFVITLVSSSINIALDAFFVFINLGPSGIAIATTISSFANAAMLFIGIKRVICPTLSLDRFLIKSLAKISISTIVATSMTIFINDAFHEDPLWKIVFSSSMTFTYQQSNIVYKIFVLIRSLAYFSITFFGAAAIVKDRSSIELLSTMKEALKKYGK